MAHIAIIPARGGSKRVPEKNIRILGGIPLIAWTIQAALDSKCFDRVVVSTDEERIAAVAKRFGAEVPFIRPKELSGDRATSDQVIKHCIDFLDRSTDLNIETITLLQPTSPLRTAKHIQESFNLLRLKNADAVISITECSSKFELSNTLPANHSLAGFLKQTAKRTQEMKKLYEINGAIYLFKKSFSGELSKLYEKDIKSFAYIMEEKYSVDIDSELDLKWAAFLIENRE